MAIYVKNTLRFTVNNTVRAHVNSESIWVVILNGRENSFKVYNKGHQTLEEKTLVRCSRRLIGHAGIKMSVFWETTIFEG